MQNPLIIIGIVFLLLAGVIIRTQLRAGDCPRHVKLAGVLAWLIAFVCLGMGAYLIAISGFEPRFLS